MCVCDIWHLSSTHLFFTAPIFLHSHRIILNPININESVAFSSLAQSYRSSVSYCVTFLHWEWAFQQQLWRLNISIHKSLKWCMCRLHALCMCVCVAMRACMCVYVGHKNLQERSELTGSACRICFSSFLQVFSLLPILSAGGTQIAVSVCRCGFSTPHFKTVVYN